MQKTPPPSPFHDYLSLTKPKITGMCVMMTAGGFSLAAQTFSWPTFLLTLAGTALVVGGSCVLNMYLEREGDKTMQRTAQRPLPTGRIAPHKALAFGIALAGAGALILVTFANLLTASLSLLALVIYVGIYTPLKRKTPWFLLIGTIPGAIPPLLGWTAVTGRIEIGGISLFALLVAWQMPHFLALSLMCKNDYEKAGIRVLSVTRGEAHTRFQALLYSILLLSVSLLLVPLQIASGFYFSVALFSGLWFLWLAFQGVLPHTPERWPLRFFLASLIYLPVLTLGLLLDQMLRFSLGV